MNPFQDKFLDNGEHRSGKPDSGKIKLPDNAIPTAEHDTGFDKWRLVAAFNNADKEYIETFKTPVYDENDFKRQELNSSFQN